MIDEIINRGENMMRKLSIKSEIFYWGIIFFLIMSVVLGIGIAKPNFYSMIESAEVSIEDSSQYVAHFAEKAFRESDTLLEVLSEDRDVIEAYRNQEARQRALNKYKMMSLVDQDISYVYSGYKDGSILISDYNVPDGFDSRERPWYLGITREDENRKVTYRDISSNDWLFSNSRVIYDGDEFIGVLSVDISNENLNGILSKGRKHDSQRSYIMDEDLMIVVHPDDNHIGKILTDVAEIKSDSSIWQDGGHFKYELEGDVVWGFYRAIEGTDYMVVTSVDEDEILAPIISSSIRMLIAILLISIVLSTLFSKALFNRIGLPIQKLGYRIDKIAREEPLEEDDYGYSNPQVASTAISVEKIARQFVEASNRSLQASENKYKRLIENLSGEYFFYIVDMEGELEYVSPSVQDMLGYTPEEFLRQDRTLTRRGLDERFFKEQNREIEIETARGDKRIIEVTEVLIRERSGEIVALEGIAKDITEKKERQLEIEYLSFHDSMTGLYNRRFFEAELSRLDVSRNYPISILYGDINGLKLANDIFGHEVGDKLIMTVSKIIKMECRGDDIIARIGGDEYAIILPKANRDVVEGIVSRIMKAIERERLNGIVVSVSFGWATKQSEGEALEDTLKKADERMYKKKLKESPVMRRNTVELIISKAEELGIVQAKIKSKDADILDGLSRELELDDRERELLFESYRLRNIGKYALDKSILESTEKLKNSDWNSVKRHPELGYRILSATPKYERYADFILYHHENWDSTGYPNGIGEKSIPLISRVIAVVDAYSSMVEDRKFRRAYDRDFAISEIKSCSGKRYDPDIVDIFLRIV